MINKPHILLIDSREDPSIGEVRGIKDILEQSKWHGMYRCFYEVSEVENQIRSTSFSLENLVFALIHIHNTGCEQFVKDTLWQLKQKLSVLLFTGDAPTEYERIRYEDAPEDKDTIVISAFKLARNLSEMLEQWHKQ